MLSLQTIDFNEAKYDYKINFFDIHESNLIKIPINKFPNGEIVCQLDKQLNAVFDKISFNEADLLREDDTIVVHWDTINLEGTLADETMMLMLLVNAIKNFSGYKLNGDKPKICLSMNMLPYARQDRQTVDGTSISNKVFIDLINSLDFSCVFVKDIHSENSKVLFKDGVLWEKGQLDCFIETVLANDKIKELLINGNDKEYIVFISPDAGAYKKIFDIAIELNRIYHLKVNVVTAQKHRDLKTGQITDTQIDLISPLKQMGVDINTDDVHLFVVDDICDGGRTFIELSKAIDNNIGDKPNVKKYLYVTHGLFTKGKQLLFDFYDDVLCNNERISNN